MIEVYRDSSEYIAHTVYYGGMPTEVDGDIVSVRVVNPFTEEEWTINDVKDLNLGRYEVMLPLAATKYDATLKTYWTYSINGEVITREEDVEVVTPYISYEEIMSMHPQLYSRNYEEIRMMERRVRHVINEVAGQDFGIKKKNMELTGSGSFSLSERLYHVHYYTVNGMHGAMDHIHVLNDGWLVQVTYPPGYYHVKSDTFLRPGQPKMTVILHGNFGWQTVPNDINLAAGLLIGDYFCNDAVYRQKGVKTVRAADWRIEYHDLAFKGTGNMEVDLLLSKYHAFNMVII